jgi:DNA polymerase-3 subunit gamma/tau
MVFYRKYRPQTIEELDLESVREKLESILRARELPHAFLFTGPKGLGKTSAARILAKAINCFKNQEARIKKQGKKPHDSKFMIHDSNGVEPCNKCDACTSITNGSNIDVIEIDAASNRGIDEIRDLREKIKYAPASLYKKVYIVDEVHMLTQDAFNALLKTLEEPPLHAVFILCTTEAEKIPGTITSRTFHIQFRKPTKAEIIHSLERVAKGEKIDIEKEVLGEIFRLSEGSFRDAAKILEELVIGSPGKKITQETLSANYQTAGLEAEVEKILSALSKKDHACALKIIDELSKKGTDFKILTEIIAQTLHEMLINGSDIFQAHELKELLDLVNQSYRDIKFSVLPQIPLELAVAEWCLTPIQNSKFKIQNSEEKPHSKDEEKPAETKNEESITKNEKEHGMFAQNAKSDNFMAALLSGVKKDNHSIAGILRGTKLTSIDGNTVQFETKYKFHKDRLSDPKIRVILDSRASEILKEKVHVVVNLIEK